MLLFSIQVLFVLITVSEAAKFDDYGIDHLEENLRRVNQKHQDSDELLNDSDQKPKGYDKAPCPDRRALSGQLVYQDAPLRKVPDSADQWTSIMPVSIRNEEFLIPTERLVLKKQSKQDQKSPDEILQKVDLSTQLPNYASPRTPYRVSVIKNTEHVIPIIPEEIDSQTNIPPKLKPQQTRNYDLENVVSPKSKSEKISEYIIRHNEDVPSHKEHYNTIYHVPIQNNTIKPHEFLDLLSSPNLNREPEPSEVHHSHLIATLKSKTKHNHFAASDNCNQKSEELFEDFLSNPRRLMSQDRNVGHSNDNQPNHVHVNEKLHQNLLKRKENDDDTKRYSPGLQYPSASRVPLHSVTIVSPRSTLFQEPTVLMEPTYQLSDPTKGAGIAPLSDIKGHMMESSKVCYACSTLNDPSCWLPDRTTTVKYCRPGHDVCVTKSYRSISAASLIVIRDCSSSCDVNTPGLDTHYDSCAVCKEDLCNNLYIQNSAFSFSPINSIFIFILFIKYVF